MLRVNLNRCRNLNLAVQKFRFYTDFLLHYQWFLNNNHIPQLDTLQLLFKNVNFNSKNKMI